MQLSSYRTLGNSGLVVSPMALGTMTFGTKRWGTDQQLAEAIFNAYVDDGGNFVDTADVYAGGLSEEIVGQCIAKRRLRDQVVLGTKFTWNPQPGNPNAGGNGRKNIHRALEASLARLKVDYIDLYWLHFWDMVTPLEEVLLTLDQLVASGKIRYFALSDVPAWYAAKMTALAAERGISGPIALQTEYSLVERSAEWEIIPASLDGGIGVMPWSPLAGGFLAGKYDKEGDHGATGGRLGGANPFGQTKFTDRNWTILSGLRQVATRLGCPPAEAALAWAINRQGISSLIIGASKLEQLRSNLKALMLGISAEETTALDQVSAPPTVFPYTGFNSDIQRTIFGGTNVKGWRR